MSNFPKTKFYTKSNATINITTSSRCDDWMRITLKSDGSHRAPGPVLAKHQPSVVGNGGPEHGLEKIREMATGEKIMRPVRIFTPDNLLRIRTMAGEGSSAIEIAKSIGSTPASVKNVCCRHKIKIRRRGEAVRKALSQLVAHLPASLSVEFHRKAEDLHMPASVLASRLLAAIVNSKIYEAVLDDKD